MPGQRLDFHPAAIATPIGWAHEKTGEQLVATHQLEPAEGTETYVPNSPAWMEAYQNGAAPEPEPEPEPEP